MAGLGAGAGFKKSGIEAGFGAEVMTGYQFSREGKSNGSVSDAQIGMNVKTSGYEFDARLFKGGTSIIENGAEYSEGGPSCCGGALSVGDAKLDASGNASMSLTLGLGKIEVTVDIDAYMEAYGDEQLKSNTGNL